MLRCKSNPVIFDSFWAYLRSDPATYGWVVAKWDRTRTVGALGSCS